MRRHLFVETGGRKKWAQAQTSLGRARLGGQGPPDIGIHHYKEQHSFPT